MGGAGDELVRVTRVRVSFDRFPSKYDEWYLADSKRLQPPGMRVSRVRGQPPVAARRAARQAARAREGGRTAVAGAEADELGESLARGTLEADGGGDPLPRLLTDNPGALATIWTDSVPLPSGATGLRNLGNTCYLNSVVQSLAHTPLLREYLLSGRYQSEVNVHNDMGTRGKIAGA